MTTAVAEAPSTTNQEAQSPVSIRGALNGLRTILAEQIAESERAIARAQQGLQFVSQIETVLGYEPAATIERVALDIPQNGNGNGNGTHAKPNVTPEDRQVAKEEKAAGQRSPKAQKAFDKLTPQKQKLYKLLERRGENFSPKELIAEKLELSDPNQVGALVSNSRADGVDIETAFALRKEGVEIPENVQGYRLGPEFRLG